VSLLAPSVAPQGLGQGDLQVHPVAAFFRCQQSAKLLDTLTILPTSGVQAGQRRLAVPDAVRLFPVALGVELAQGVTCCFIIRRQFECPLHIPDGLG